MFKKIVWQIYVSLLIFPKKKSKENELILRLFVCKVKQKKISLNCIKIYNKYKLTRFKHKLFKTKYKFSKIKWTKRRSCNALLRVYNVLSGPIFHPKLIWWFCMKILKPQLIFRSLKISNNFFVAFRTSIPDAKEN